MKVCTLDKHHTGCCISIARLIYYPSIARFSTYVKNFCTSTPASFRASSSKKWFYTKISIMFLKIWKKNHLSQVSSAGKLVKETSGSAWKLHKKSYNIECRSNIISGRYPPESNAHKSEWYGKEIWQTFQVLFCSIKVRVFSVHFSL